MMMMMTMVMMLTVISEIPWEGTDPNVEGEGGRGAHQGQSSAHFWSHLWTWPR